MHVAWRRPVVRDNPRQGENTDVRKRGAVLDRPWGFWRCDDLMTTKSDFPQDEWARIVRAPFVAGLAISLADPGGPIEAAKESMATIRSATNPPTREQLLAEVALELQALTQQRHNPLKGYKPTS